jgi:hypothetical protein
MQRRNGGRSALSSPHLIESTLCSSFRFRELPKFGSVTPKLSPWLARTAANKDVGMIPAFFIDDAPRVAGVTGEAAVDEEFVCAFA